MSESQQLKELQLDRNFQKVLGCKVDLMTFENAFEMVKDFFVQKKSAHIVTINPEMIMRAQSDKVFKNILDEADMVIPDGVGVTLALKTLGINQDRIAGIDFSYRVLQYCAQNSLKVALVGSQEDVIFKAKDNLCKKIDGLDVVFVHHGYFENDDEILQKLEGCSPDLLLLGLGSPRQEKLIYNYKKILKSTIMIGVGGSFDVFAGKVQRAPEFFQKVGLEWFYRLAIEPSRFSRIFPILPMFLFKVIASPMASPDNQSEIIN